MVDTSFGLRAIQGTSTTHSGLLSNSCARAANLGSTSGLHRQYPSIRAVLNSDEALQQSIARLNGLEKGKVKLGAFNSVCAGLLPDILKGFMAQFPQIEVEVYQGTYDDVKEWLRTGQVDMAFLSNNCREEFTLTELFREPLLCITPMAWPETPRGVMTPELMNGSKQCF